MPHYKLMFQDASWQDRQFISLTKINDDGTINILHAVHCKKDGQQISFGTYAKGTEKRWLEFQLKQTYQMTSSMNEPYAEERMYSHLFQGDILAQIMRDQAFLETVLQSAISGNHKEYINAAKKLNEGICVKQLDFSETNILKDYRDFIVKYYFSYLLNTNRMKVNAHPQGFYTVIQAAFTHTYRGPGVNDLPIEYENAVALYTKMQSLLTSHFPGWPVIFEYRFLGTSVPSVGNGMFLEITELTAEQKIIVDNLFETARRQHFFPTNPQEMLQKAWVAMGGKLASPESANRFFTPPKRSSSPGLVQSSNQLRLDTYRM